MSVNLLMITLENIGYHSWQNVCQCSCQFKHDDHYRHRDVHDPAQGCRSAEKCVSPWSDAGHVWLTGREESGVRKAFMQSLYENTDHPAERSPNRH